MEIIKNEAEITQKLNELVSRNNRITAQIDSITKSLLHEKVDNGSEGIINVDSDRYKTINHIALTIKSFISLFEQNILEQRKDVAIMKSIRETRRVKIEMLSLKEIGNNSFKMAHTESFKKINGEKQHKKYSKKLDSILQLVSKSSMDIAELKGNFKKTSGSTQMVLENYFLPNTERRFAATNAAGRYEGTCLGGVPDGKGKWTGIFFEYEGNWLKGSPHGRGVVKELNNIDWEGDWDKGVLVCK